MGVFKVKVGVLWEFTRVCGEDCAVDTRSDRWRDRSRWVSLSARKSLRLGEARASTTYRIELQSAEELISSLENRTRVCSLSIRLVANR